MADWYWLAVVFGGPALLLLFAFVAATAELIGERHSHKTGGTP